MNASVTDDICTQETINQFGYNPNLLPPKSGRRIIVVCRDCNIQFIRKKIDVSNALNKRGCYLCRRCSNLRQVAILSDPKYQKKREETLFKKYGTDNLGKSKFFKDKAKATCIKRYGVDHVSKSKEYQERKKKKMLEEFGVEFYVQTEQFKTASKGTLLNKYGVDNAAKSPEVQRKISDTNNDRYGVTCVFACKSIKDKITATIRNKYGVDHIAQHADTLERRKNTLFQRYGVDNPTKNVTILKKSMATKLKNYGTLAPVNLGRTEREIGDWLLSSGFKFSPNTSVLSGYEIDLYNDVLKLGIEYCGLYWHSDAAPKKKDRSYHYNKFKTALDLGVRLLTIFEDEWLHRQKQVKNFIRSILGLNDKIYARKCIIKDIPKNEATQFLEDTHIQGAAVNSKYFAGAYYKDELVGVMTFGLHPRKSNVIVLDRLSFKDGVSVVGGASRLLNFIMCKRNIKEVISWSDNRWSDGGVYHKMGFTIDAILPPDYSYCNKSKCTRVSKQSQKKKTTKCPEGKTEKEWCEERGLYRIWDCGKIRWILRKD